MTRMRRLTMTLSVALLFLPCFTTPAVRVPGAAAAGGERPVVAAALPYAFGQDAQEPADAFDDPSAQPRSKYTPRLDRTRPPVRRDPRLNAEVLRLVTSPATLAVREVPLRSNRGPEVDRYLQYCDIRPPAWWCAAFVSYEIKEASNNS